MVQKLAIQQVTADSITTEQFSSPNDYLGRKPCSKLQVYRGQESSVAPTATVNIRHSETHVTQMVTTLIKATG